ncbi:hypothetical protein ACFFNY_17195 [Paenibacillus hodogayensis]|uniref:Fibronectin type-III domain-containing protein n=1 Tax=Paenibacillus hodogayensis TaxID=279208 RepID=A0ABV5VYB5_9BACL
MLRKFIWLFTLFTVLLELCLSTKSIIHASPEIGLEVVGEQFNKQVEFLNKSKEDGKKKKREKTQELESKRTEYSKTFINNDNTVTVVKTTHSQHYQSEGKWLDIDNNIKDLSESHFGNTKENGNSFFFEKERAVTKVVYEDYFIKYEAITERTASASVQDDVLIYPDVWQDVDIRYRTMNDSLKMEMVLKTSLAPKNMRFKVETKGLLLQKNTDGSLSYSNEDGKVVYIIPEMWVMDSSNNDKRYDNVTTNLITNSIDNEQILEIIVDSQGLQYPLLIDPTTTRTIDISYDSGNTFYVDTSDIDVSKIIELKISNSTHSGNYIPQNMPAQIFLTREEYGDLNGYDYPGSDGRNVTWISETSSFDGFGNYSILDKNDVIRLYGGTGKFYGVVFYNYFFVSYYSYLAVEITYTVDQTSPSNLRAEITPEFSVKLTWDPAPNPSLVNKYEVLMNNSVIQNTSSTQVYIYGLPKNKNNYRFSVQSRLVDGTTSPTSNEVHIELNDASAPSNLDWYPIPDGSIGLYWTPADEPSLVSSYQVFVNGVEMKHTQSDRIFVRNFFPGRNYKFKIRSVRTIDGAYSDFTNEVEFKKAESSTYRKSYEYGYETNGRLSYVDISNSIRIYYHYDKNGNPYASSIIDNLIFF